MEGRWREDGGKMEGRWREDGGKMEGRWREDGGKTQVEQQSFGCWHVWPRGCDEHASREEDASHPAKRARQVAVALGWLTLGLLGLLWVCGGSDTPLQACDEASKPRR